MTLSQQKLHRHLDYQNECDLACVKTRNSGLLIQLMKSRSLKKSNRQDHDLVKSLEAFALTLLRPNECSLHYTDQSSFSLINFNFKFNGFLLVRISLLTQKPLSLETRDLTSDIAKSQL